YEWAWMGGRKYLVVGDWVPIHGDKLVWRFDADTGEYNPDALGIRVTGASGFGPASQQWHKEHADRIEPTDWGMAYFLAPWERELIVVHKHIIEDGEYEDPLSAGRIFGVGIRDRIYWTWYQKQEALAWLMEFLERSGFGMELWYYPYGNPQAEAEFRKAATERIGQGRNIVLIPRMPGPDALAYGVDRVEPGTAGASVLRDIVHDYFGRQIKRYILGQTLTTEVQPTGLGSNLASIHLDTYLQIVLFDARNLQETLTRDLIRPLVKYNWPNATNFDVRFVIETSSPDVEEKLAAWKTAWEMGARLRERDVMELIGAAPPTETDRVLEIRPNGQAAPSAEGNGSDRAIENAG
ncbi:MAG: phage portal protein family protein, partial [Kiritimatiellia bacterium]